MKKIKLTGRLSLNKETIARLNNQQMGAIQGGAPGSADCATNAAGGCDASLNDTVCHQSAADGACQSGGAVCNDTADCAWGTVNNPSCQCGSGSNQTNSPNRPADCCL